VTSVGPTLEQHAADAELHRLQQVGSIDSAGQHDRAQIPAIRLESAHGVQARHARHRQVEQQQIGVDGLNDADRVVSAPGFAHDLESRADVDAINLTDDRRRHRQQLPQARPKQALVVGEDDPNGPVGTGKRRSRIHRCCS
jgi:hypothetical protein